MLKLYIMQLIDITAEHIHSANNDFTANYIKMYYVLFQDLIILSVALPFRIIVQNGDLYLFRLQKNHA